MSKLHKKQYGHDLLPIHLSVSEIKSLNYLQGGQFIDEETGLREFSRLSKILRIPEIRNLFIEFSDVMHKRRPISPEAASILQKLEGTTDFNKFYQEIPSDSDPEIRHLASLADSKNDTKVVLMPSDVVNFMDLIRGEIRKDPVMRLEEFGLMDEIFRGVATVGGAVLGGPIGAGVGNYFGKVATGADPSTNILPAAKVGLATWGLGQAASGLGASFPGLASSAPGVFGANASWGATPSMFQSAAAAAPSATGTTAAAASANPSSWNLGNASKWLIPGALMAGGLFTANKQNKKEHEIKQEIEVKRRQDARKLRKHYGFEEPLGVTLKGPEEIRSPEYKNYKKGGLIGRPIVGKGKGQEDLINDDRVKEGGWIWNATLVSDLGDGSTKAGQKELEGLEKFIAKKSGNLKKYNRLDHGGTPRNIPCALSDGERYTPPEIVTAAGDGSNKEGAAKFREITKSIRAHKISKGTDLPPPAPPAVAIFKKVG